MARRSRTGCATCRKRKLKCDENRPVCGQCTKSRRECIPSEGVAFRHEQNAAMNAGVQGNRTLGNFFKYRNQFTDEQLACFLPLPKDLIFILIDDPFAEDQNPSHGPSASEAYQQVAAHSLQALSAAAERDKPHHLPPSSYAEYGSSYAAANINRSGYGPARGDMSGIGIHGPNHQNNGIGFLLNPSSNTPSNLIDPNLEASIAQEMEHGQAEPVEQESMSRLDPTIDMEREDHPHPHSPEDDGRPEEQVAYLLRNFAPGTTG